ncbi:DUF1627 domain-containing protein [Salmonella enterica subsp. enterica serovar Kottbus]|nr:DUF1627 domain-containing protein [Salmonella enterica subsp. enterica serovar Kottbus]EBY6716618.1 DUF1627 domain-containing protein [Salmonella enterica subsp. enterica serovar Kottbus]EBZ6410167.1 DUF1627 domain-containing protein [Salmonella enterica subsp. enterica serovar Kottbus]ECB3489076.1 DUF1627 domain-containing protein [Salmonella enterica subsp. enterica serovar Kottbus]ECY6288051.1 DUF1627 domain-containing protein [Salmonella enterica subsp. enterica serovar Kottbus]
METVIDALKAMGKASSHEVASRLGITRDEAVNGLWELKRRGQAVNHGPMWWLAEKAKNAVERPQSDSCAEVVQCDDCVQGKVIESDRNRFLSTENVLQSKESTDMVQSIPSFTEKRPDHVIFPSLHVANRELRRAKGQVQKWERVCAALRELNKPGSRRLLAQLSQQGE